MKEFVVRTVLFLDFLLAAPLFAALIWIDPGKYVAAMESGAGLRAKILKYREEGKKR